METFWRRCSTCKRVIGFAAPYWICSVSTCNRKGSSFVFCSMPCWDSHVPTLRHRDAWAEEQRSPTREEWGAESRATGNVSHSTAAARSATAPATGDEDSEEEPLTSGADVPREVLIIASKLKKYVRARSGMNTSDAVMEVLSTRVRSLCDDAIVRAREDGRKTLMDRDF